MKYILRYLYLKAFNYKSQLTPIFSFSKFIMITLIFN